VGDTVFAASRIGTIYHILVSTGEATRLAALHWPLTSGPVVYDSLLLVGGADGTVRAVTRDGHDLWRIAAWRPVELEPVPLAPGLLVIGGNGDFHLYAR
jgi:hypothetical protein